MGSLPEKGSHPILSTQTEVLGKVLLPSLAAASSTPTELYANSSRFPPLVPNWPHVGFFPPSHCILLGLWSPSSHAICSEKNLAKQDILGNVWERRVQAKTSELCSKS